MTSLPTGVGPLQLLMLQPTPFCNLDCDYCYLPGRTRRDRMPIPTAELAIVRAIESGLVTQDFRLAWHVGEPLVVGQEWYRQVDRLVRRHCTGLRVTSTFQSNAVLIDDEWCDLFEETHAELGISIDGPEHIHNAHRKTRSGQGTFKAVMKGVDTLHRNNVPFGVLAVVTREFLNDFNTALDFFETLEMNEIGFNVEVIEGSHEYTTMNPRRRGTLDLFRDFTRECYRRHSAGRLKIREIREYEELSKNAAFIEDRYEHAFADHSGGS